ncbi:ATP-dependent DNA helicase RecQ [Empedobacter falsenii]|uniref:helicase-related protein n=1 Tax=Empedobacter falsenii TaxID=343874 RepID=UPI0025755606|nr:helicase-related protein [Empedobacter falsenii]MDM1063786.1 ATP-dependent DNA helicase RecQ [Empedobacter falsenii]
MKKLISKEVIASKINDFLTKYANTHTLITIKGLPIELIPNELKKSFIDNVIFCENKINEDILFSRKTRVKIKNQLLDDLVMPTLINYESLLLIKPYQDDLFENEIAILDFSISSYCCNNFLKFNLNIADLNEIAEVYDFDDMYASIISNSIKAKEKYYIQFADQELLTKTKYIEKIVQLKDWDFNILNKKNEEELELEDFVFNPESNDFLDFFYELFFDNSNVSNIYIDNETLKNPLGKEIISKLIYTAELLNKSIDLKRVVHNLNKEVRLDLFNLLEKHWNANPPQFKPLKIYADPDISKDVIEISQSDVVENIIQQFENGYKEQKDVQDIFLTAPTGAGKSLLFQMPAIYIGEKYKALSIVVSPLKALMVDQVNQLIHEKNYNKVAYINSDITVIQREDILERIKNNDIDVLYLAPELLLSYEINYFLNGRKLGLYIVDEAHTVSTWGRDFRIDYWYLGFHINRIRKYVKDEEGNSFNFPVVAVTATATYNGKHDVAFETMKSLQMKSPIKYIGYARRDNIVFDINQVDKIEGNLQTEKVEITVQKIEEYLTQKEKVIVYCPFTTQVTAVTKKANDKGLNTYGFHGSMNVDDQNKSYLKFKNQNAVTMVATKAFGMGVDISDINRVYHFAPTGLLPDYIQEIGRSARNPNSIGYASVDFSDRDFQFINQLHGLSRLHNWQLTEVMKKLVRIYDEDNKQNHLLNIDDFSYIFQSESSDRLTNEVKKALLLLEKDLNEKFDRIPVIIARPKNMFSTVFANIRESELKNFIKIYGNESINRLPTNQFNEFQKSVIRIDLDKIWEDKFREIPFSVLKYKYFKNDLFENFDISPKLKIVLTINNSYGEMMTLFQNNLNIIDASLNSMDGFFKIKDFKNKLIQFRMKEEMAERVSNIILSMFSKSSNNLLRMNDVLNDNNFLQSRKESGEVDPKYRLVDRAFGRIIGNLKRALSSTFGSGKTEMEKYFSQDSAQKKLYVKTGQLLELFNLGNYEIVGGENPKMFVRINDPFRLRLEANNNYYKNNLLEDVRERHFSGVELMKDFFKSDLTSDQRWDFIEDYLLGRKE